MGGMFCDLYKAFSCVNHGILLSKLEFYGIKGSSLKQIKSYLQDRYQKVQLSTQNYYTLTSKDWRKISHVVPRRSILGPLLFPIYINDLPLTLENNSIPILFTDDTSVLISHTDNNSQLNILGVFEQLNRWFCRSQWPRGLRCRSTATRLLRWWVQIPLGHGCLSVVSVVCCQVEVSVTG